MEIVNFFEKLAGKWFSQRTTHALSTQQSKAGKSDLEVTFLDPTSDEVQQLCQSHQSAEGSATPLCGLRIQQSSTVDGDTQAKVATTLLVPLKPSTQASDQAGGQTTGEHTSNPSGSLLRSGGEGKSTYTLEEEVLTIISNSPEARSEERMWFITDNLRMRTGMTELASGLRVASFCSEIRMGVKPPKAE